MKKHLLIISSIILATATFAQEINFEKGTWAEIKAKAKDQKKIIFMDAFTSWCGPCKAMAKNTFTNKDVATLYNSNFINAKIDMEKGDGPAIAKQYQVNCYPNLLFIDADGNLVHRAAGYLDAKDFLTLGKVALSPERTFSSIQKQFESINARPGIAEEYFDLLSKSCLSANDAAVKYLSAMNESELSSATNWGIIRDYIDEVQSKPFIYFLKNRKEFGVKYTVDSVNEKIFAAYSYHANSLIYRKDFDSSAVIRFVKEIQATGFERNEELLLTIDLAYFQRLEKWDIYYKTCQSLIKNYKQNDLMFLNNVSWTIFEKCSDKAQLAEAELWAKKSVEIKAESFNMDTYANLLFKNGKKQEAINTEKKAIELAKEAGQDPKDYEETLLKFEGKK